MSKAVSELAAPAKAMAGLQRDHALQYRTSLAMPLTTKSNTPNRRGLRNWKSLVSFKIMNPFY